jgi:hypothetical protein
MHLTLYKNFKTRKPALALGVGKRKLTKRKFEKKFGG